MTGRDQEDISSVPPARLIAPAVVRDDAANVTADPDFLVEVEHIRAFVDEHGPLHDGGWLLCRTAGRPA
ncbi:cyclase family protein [Georgenia sp. SYP-B2076]|uniref:cyclase family protein n=1 Tax=Georgenia sp. SYP-B2076 TaxID=2495881 RepID=UPI0035136988